MSGGGHKPETELERLSRIIDAFNELFGGIKWDDADMIRRLITEEIPQRVAADQAYTNARKRPDRANARVEHDAALGRVLVSLMKDNTQLFKQWSDNDGFRRWLSDSVFGETYRAP